MFKIGFSLKDPAIRSVELDSTGLPFRWQVEYFVFVDEPFIVEQRVHSELKHSHVSKEFFKLELTSAIVVIHKVIKTLNYTPYYEECEFEKRKKVEEQLIREQIKEEQTKREELKQQQLALQQKEDKLYKTRVFRHTNELLSKTELKIEKIFDKYRRYYLMLLDLASDDDWTSKSSYISIHKWDDKDLLLIANYYIDIKFVIQSNALIEWSGFKNWYQGSRPIHLIKDWVIEEIKMRSKNASNPKHAQFKFVLTSPLDKYKTKCENEK